jgi:Ca2+-binding RTX toxin-like protein
MTGGTGDDLFVVNSSSDVVTEASGEGTDSVQSSATFTLGNNVENLTLTGTGNSNGTGNTLANIIAGNTGNNTLDGGDGNDTVDGGSGTDSLSGGNNNDSLAGGAGADSLNGGAGNDTMAGGADNDTYVVDSASDVVSENAGEGTDSVQSSVTYTLSNDVENLTLTGSGAINGTGNSLANVITGNSGANIIGGGDGNDTIDGAGGNDTITGGAGSDTISVSSGNDRVLYTSILDVGDVVTNFDFSGGSGSQDFVDLDGLFDSLGVAAGARAGRLSLLDTGADINLLIDADGNGSFETTLMTFQGIANTSSLTIGTSSTSDIQIGT